MWSLERPLYLIGLLAIPLLVYFTQLRRQRGGVPRFTLEVWRGERFRAGWTWSHFAAGLSRLTFWGGLATLVVAAAGPITLVRERVHLLPGADIVIVLDESPSMAARDYGAVSRFEAARAVLREFISGRENDAIGLVTFSDRAALRVPRTTEYGHLYDALQDLQVMTLGDATAIGMGIGVATLHLRHGSGPSQAMILMTDGDNNAGEILPETAAQIAADLGIRIYTIGIGREGDTILEFTNPDTGATSRGVYRGRFDEALLLRIAQLTGGRYFVASERGALESIFAEIDGLERSETRTRIVVRREQRHVALLIVGLALILLDLGIRRALLREVL